MLCFMCDVGSFVRLSSFLVWVNWGVWRCVVVMREFRRSGVLGDVLKCKMHVIEYHTVTRVSDSTPRSCGAWIAI